MCPALINLHALVHRRERNANALTFCPELTPRDKGTPSDCLHVRGKSSLFANVASTIEYTKDHAHMHVHICMGNFRVDEGKANETTWNPSRLRARAEWVQSIPKGTMSDWERRSHDKPAAKVRLIIIREGIDDRWCPIGLSRTLDLNVIVKCHDKPLSRSRWSYYFKVFILPNLGFEKSDTLSGFSVYLCRSAKSSVSVQQIRSMPIRVLTMLNIELKQFCLFTVGSSSC